MPTITNVAYIQKAGTITIASDDYTSGVSSFALVPTTPTAKHVDIGGGVQQFAGTPEWVAQITFAQDWTTAASLSKKSIEWAGQTKTLVYTPQTGAAPVTVTVTFQPSQIGGGAGSVPTATLNLGVTGQPIFGTPEEP
ncbi:hypothetical protein [Microbacterium sp. No. 7]|uniref:hypothetical protein n=1 Tax=Microbacterium sp. No. 7 TaxID=1714373 RepID=UPI0006D00EA8|nr:hypothetical protein [Microbacterium sp. No. 7]ALJ20318.1 hypothetical protein AOA12_10505 [Microbacterium sp. No. 7]